MKVVIVVKGGMVQQVFSTSSDVSVLLPVGTGPPSVPRAPGRQVHLAE